VRPIVDKSLAFDARAARHPVVEAAVKRAGDPYTPNDCRLDAAGEIGARLSIVTGPNMAGKSTFLRQNALLAILAQSGCYVPAKRLRLGVVDRLFSRVGAGDDLARGRSTFMMEMVETAAILTQASPRSLVILDEIGRGTATYDGLAIAWACAEALHDTNRCRALFATHYHELATLETRLAHVSNLSLRAKEWNGDLVFLHEAARRSRRPLLRRAGGQAGRRARPRSWPAPARCWTAWRARPNHRPSWTTCRCSPPGHVGARQGGAQPRRCGPERPGCRRHEPREALEALYRLKALLKT
jgi:DNA mismatch repair protein MutS